MKLGRVTKEAAGVEYMTVGYKLIGEPLNLWERGQRWFSSLYNFHTHGLWGEETLVLGAVSWMADLLAKKNDEVNVIDTSEGMLSRLRSEVCAETRRKLKLLQGDWSDLNLGTVQVGVTLSDNSFTYMEFPAGWDKLLTDLASQMRPAGLLFLRCFSLPSNHKSISLDKLIESYRHRQEINYTEVRAHLLFSQCDMSTYTIDTEKVLEKFDHNRSAFSCLLNKSPKGQLNDLETVEKYRESGAIYYTPPLTEIMNAVSRNFRILSINYGPYPLAEYFPLIVASRR